MRATLMFFRQGHESVESANVKLSGNGTQSIHGKVTIRWKRLHKEDYA